LECFGRDANNFCLFSGEEEPTLEISLVFFAVCSEHFRGIILRVHSDRHMADIGKSVQLRLQARHLLTHQRAGTVATREHKGCNPYLVLQACRLEGFSLLVDELKVMDGPKAGQSRCLLLFLTLDKAISGDAS